MLLISNTLSCVMEKLVDVMVNVREDLSIYILYISIYILPKKPNLPHTSAVATPHWPAPGPALCGAPSIDRIGRLRATPLQREGPASPSRPWGRQRRTRSGPSWPPGRRTLRGPTERLRGPPSCGRLGEERESCQQSGGTVMQAAMRRYVLMNRDDIHILTLSHYIVWRYWVTGQKYNCNTTVIQ